MSENGAGVTVKLAADPIVGRRLEVDADMLCLATAIIPNDNDRLSRLFKVPIDGDGWMLEAHQKLRPVEFATDGIFLCGMTHYPKPIEESIAQAAGCRRQGTGGAGKRDHSRGWNRFADRPGIVFRVLTVYAGCPTQLFLASTWQKKIAEVNPALCKGCGACAAACPSEAAVLMGFSNRQLYSQIRSAIHA